MPDRKAALPLSPLVQAFHLHFGEIGSRWGINCTVGPIYALPFVSERPLIRNPFDCFAMRISASLRRRAGCVRPFPNESSGNGITADEIVERLGLSRPNVSMGLKDLQARNLMHLQHQPGDRRDPFSTQDDIWQIVRTPAEDRKDREIDPTLTMLRATLMRDAQTGEDDYAQGRLRGRHDLLELLTGWYSGVQKLETDRLPQLLTLGSKVQTILHAKDR